MTNLHASDNTQITSQKNRWHDHDPLLVELLDALQRYPDDVREQAAFFLQQLKAEIGAEAFGAFCEAQEHRLEAHQKRWYDKDKLVSQAVEILRVMSPDVQRRVTTSFMDALQKQGLS